MSMLTLEDAIDLVKREVALIERAHGRENASNTPTGWVTLFARRFAHLASSAVAGRNWWTEELVKLAATAIAALRTTSTTPGLDLDAEGLAEIAHAGGSRPAIVAKTAEPPKDAVLVAKGIERCWVGNGNVWVGVEMTR